MTWLMEIWKTYPEERLLIKYCTIDNLKLIKIRNMMDIWRVLLQWFTDFFNKKSSGGANTCVWSNPSVGQYCIDCRGKIRYKTNSVETLNWKGKILKETKLHFFANNFSKYLSIDNMKITGFMQTCLRFFSRWWKYWCWWYSRYS